jgi:hypothetical protein
VTRGVKTDEAGRGGCPLTRLIFTRLGVVVAVVDWHDGDHMRWRWCTTSAGELSLGNGPEGRPAAASATRPARTQAAAAKEPSRSLPKGQCERADSMVASNSALPCRMCSEVQQPKPKLCSTSSIPPAVTRTRTPVGNPQVVQMYKQAWAAVPSGRSKGSGRQMFPSPSGRPKHTSWLPEVTLMH